MAIVIQQSEADVQLAFEVHRNAEIIRVRLARANLRSVELAGTTEAKVNLSFRFKPKQVPGPPNELRIEVAFHMRGDDGPLDVEPGKKSNPAVLVECVYEAIYLLKPELNLTLEHARAFQEGNAIFNLWPYFREFVQSHMAAMGLPPLTAPFLRLQPLISAPGSPPPPKPKKRKKKEFS